MRILSLGQKLRRIRKEKGLTLEALGGSHVSKAHLSIIENGKASPSIDLLKYLSDKLEVDMEYLLETEKQQATRFSNILLDEMRVNIKLGKIGEAKKIYDEISEIASEFRLLDILGESNLVLSQGYVKIKEFLQGLKHIQQSIYYSIKADNISRVVKCYNFEGEVYSLQKKHEIAIQKFIQGLSFYNQLKHEDLNLEINIYYNLASSYYKLGNRLEALKYVEEAYNINQIIDNPKEYVENLIKYSRNCVLNNDFKSAEKILKKAKSLIENEEHKNYRAHIENNLGLVYLLNGQYEEAYDHLQKSKSIKEENKMKELPETLYTLYQYYLEKGQIEKAFEQLGYAIRYSNEMNLIDYKIQGVKLYIDYYLKNNRYSEATDKLIELIDILNKSNSNPEELMSSYLKLGNTYCKTGNTEEALEFFKKGYSLMNE